MNPRGHLGHRLFGVFSAPGLSFRLFLTRLLPAWFPAFAEALGYPGWLFCNLKSLIVRFYLIFHNFSVCSIYFETVFLWFVTFFYARVSGMCLAASKPYRSLRLCHGSFSESLGCLRLPLPRRQPPFST